MKNKKRRISLVLTVLTLLFSLKLPRTHTLFAQTGLSFDESRQYEITFWAKNDTNKYQVLIYERAISEFEKIYPNIKVNLRLYTDYGKIYNDVITNIATNTTPNICISYPDHIATYKTGQNVVVCLDDYINDQDYGLGGSKVLFDAPKKEEMVSQFLEEGIIDGQHFAMPFMRSTEACYVNKTMVEKLGYTLPKVLTWDFIWEVSEAAMKKNEEGFFIANGQKVLIPFIYKSTDNMMIQMLQQLDAGYATGYGEVKIFNDTTKELLYEIAKHAQTRAFSTFKISSYPANFLNAGQCIFAIDSTAGATWIGSKAPLLDISADQLVDFETEVMMIPQFDPKNPKMISQGPSLCLFYKEDSNEVMASWLFLQYLLTNNIQIAYAQTEGYVPVTLKAQQSKEYQEYLSLEGTDDVTHYDVKIKATKLLLDNIENTFVTPAFNGSASLRDAAGQLIEEVTKAKRRKQTVDEKFMEKLKTDITSLYRLDQIVVKPKPTEEKPGTPEQNPGSEPPDKPETAQKPENTRKDLGPLPWESKLLLGTLSTIWAFIFVFFAMNFAKNHKK